MSENVIEKKRVKRIKARDEEKRLGSKRRNGKETKENKRKLN